MGILEINKFLSFIFILSIFLFVTGCYNAKLAEKIDLAQKQLEIGATADSEKTIQNIILKIKDKKQLAKILSIKAEISAGKGMFKHSIEEIRTAVALDSQNGEIRKQSAKVYLRMGDLNRSLSEIERATEISPDDLSISALKIYILSKLYDKYTALSYARNLLREHSECQHTKKELNLIYLKIADLLVEEKEYSKAKSIYEDILKDEQQKDNALLGIANIYYLQKNTKKAEKFVLQSIEANEFNPESHILAARIYHLQNQPQKIKRELESALNHNCTTPALAIEYGFLCLRSKDLETAEKFAKLALNSAPNDPDVLGFVATVAIDKNHFQQAKEYSQKSLDLDPKNMIAHVARTEMALKNKDFKEAEKHLKICLENDDTFLIANTYMAKIKLIQNNIKESEKYIDKAIAKAPTDHFALYFKSCICATKSDKANAFKYLKKAIKHGAKGKREIIRDNCWQKYLNDQEFKKIINEIS